MEKVQLQIDGMHCGNCVGRVTRALAALPAVKVEEVKVGSAMVGVDGRQTGADDLIGAVAQAGYSARVVNTPAPSKPGCACCLTQEVRRG